MNPEKNIFNVPFTLFSLCSVIIALSFPGCVPTKPRPARHAGTGHDELQNIVDNYYHAVDSIARIHPMRLGVLPFVAADGRTSDRNEFGRYFSEKLTNRLTGAADRIKLYERSRLDALFRENSLEMSGMVNEEDARKIGELVPIDFLLSGTFTLLDSRLSISGRLIDVASGEIVVGRSDGCSLTDELSVLFGARPGNTAPHNGPTAGDTPENVCENLQSSLDKKVNGAPADKQFSTLIDEGMKIPFDTLCPRIHYEIISRCKRQRVNPPHYTDFLITTMWSIARPDADRRTEAIMGYFRADGVIDDREWNAIIEVLAKVKWVEHYLPYLIIEDTLGRELEKRLAALADLCRQGKVGLDGQPFDDVLYQVIDALGIHTRNSFGQNTRSEKVLRAIRDMLYVLRKFTPALTCSIPEKYADMLFDVWRLERYSPLSDSVFTVLCGMVAKVKANAPAEKITPVIKSICYSLIHDIFDNDTARETFHESSIAAATLFAGTCREQIVGVTRQLHPGELANSDIPALCLFTGIEAPAIPTADSISLWLSSEETDKSHRGAEYVVYMGKHAAVLEDKLIRVLRQRIRQKDEGQYENDRIVAALGAIQTRKPEAHELLFICLDSLNYLFSPTTVTRALAAIGKPVVPRMKQYFELDIDSHVYTTATFFELMGKNASEEIPYLESRAKAATDPKTKYRLEDAVERIKQRQ